MPFFKRLIKYPIHITFLFTMLLYGYDISYSVAMDDEVRIENTIANYKIFKFKNKYYSSLHDDLYIENNEVVIEPEMIIENDLKIIENKVIQLLDNEPLFHKTFASYNIVIYAGKVFGVPQGTDIDWNKDNFKNIKNLIVENSIIEVKDKILKDPYSWKPVLKDTFLRYNIVNFKDKIYGIPFGYNVDFYQSDVSKNRKLIHGEGTFTIKSKILKFWIVDLSKKLLN